MSNNYLRINSAREQRTNHVQWKDLLFAGHDWTSGLVVLLAIFRERKNRWKSAEFNCGYVRAYSSTGSVIIDWRYCLFPNYSARHKLSCEGFGSTATGMRISFTGDNVLASRTKFFNAYISTRLTEVCSFYIQNLKQSPTSEIVRTCRNLTISVFP